MLVSHGIIYRYVGRSSWHVIDFEENIKWKVGKILIKTVVSLFTVKFRTPHQLMVVDSGLYYGWHFFTEHDDVFLQQ